MCSGSVVLIYEAITKFTNTYLLELTFRSQLLAQEQELLELRNSNKELKHQLKSKEKIHKEVADLKSIISSQDDKAHFIILL